MTVRAYYDRHGVDGLATLAKAAGTELSYLRQMVYSPDKNPSLKMAIALVEASEGELTFEGLAYPQGRPRNKRRRAPVKTA